jgi:alkylation response protein AidB-like acyl-CoA dehydrogenase
MTPFLQQIRSEAAAAEKQRDLTPAMLELIYKEGWFKLLVPRRLDGQALPLPDVVRLEEDLAYADGSLAWVVTLCSGAGWFGGFLPDTFAKLFKSPHLCIAGSGSPSGEARVTKDGYQITGSWTYASGIRHATAYTANCIITEDGQQQTKAFLFLPGEIEIRNDFNAMGMIASASHGFSANKITIPANRAFSIDPSAATDTDPLYQYPFLQLAETTLAANIAGMGAHFLDCCEEYLQKKARPEPIAQLQSSRENLATIRNEFYRALDNSWTNPSPEAFAAVSRTSHALAATTRTWVDKLYPFAGLGAARIDTPINRVWRDLHTAAQHPLLVFTPPQ